MLGKRQPNNAGVCELFKKFRNRNNREILKSKKDYFAKYFSDYSNNIKKTWQGIREIINIKNPTAPKIAQLNVKLDHYGIRGSILNWIKSYLTNRKQYADINGESSKIKEISCGVPQGSVLGPLLFLLYINDLPNISKVLDFYLFADDTNIYYESNSLQDLEKKINKELGKLQLWLNVNRLALNISKINYVIFHPFNKPLNQNITLKIRKKSVSQQNYIKYLGVIIDSTLSWKHQIKNISPPQ